MTETHDKLRGLFLTALMVLSVFGGTVAFTGTVAAAHGTNATFDNRGANPGDVSPLDMTTRIPAGDTDVNEFKINFSGDPAFDGSFSGVIDGNVVIKFRSNSTGNVYASYRDDATVQSKSQKMITVQIPNDQATSHNDTVHINFTDNFENPSSTGLYSGSITVEPGTSTSNDTLIGTLNVTAAGAGPGGEIEVKEPDVILRNGSLHYIGQRLVTNGSESGTAPNGTGNNTFEAGETVQVQKQDSNDNWNTVATTSANSSAFVVFDTDDLSEGDFRFRGEQGDSITNPEPREIILFELIRQDLNTSFDDSTITTGGSTELWINSSKRSTYRTHLTSGDLSKDELQQIFGGQTGVRNTTEGVLVNVTGNDRPLNADFSDIGNGEFQVDGDVIDTTASDTAQINISDRPPEAELAKGIYEVPQGDLVEMTVNLQNTDEATLIIGDEDDGYETTVSIEDGNDDGEVTITMNTYLAGRFKGDESNAFSAENDDDTVTANLETDELDNLLDQADYTLSARTAEEGETDVGTLVVRERSTDSLNISTAPRSEYSGITDVDDLDDVPLTNKDDVANGDIMVHKVQANGVFGAIAAAAGSDTEVSSQGFANLVQQGTVTLTMVQQNPETNRDPKELEIDASLNNGALKFIPDEDNGTLFLLVRTGNSSQDAEFFRTNEDRKDVFHTEAGDEYESEFNVSKDSLLVDEDATENESVNATSTIVEPRIKFDTDDTGNVTVWSPDNTAITGTSTLAPGTEFTVRARSTGDQPFLKTAEVTVEAGGTFSTGDTLNFSDVTQFPTTFEASAQTSLADAEEDGRVIERPTATVTMNDQTVQANQAGRQTLVVASVSMNYGGFVTIHDQTLQDGATFDSVRGTSKYLTPGSKSDVQIKLDDNLQQSQTVFAMPHRDTDDDTAYTFVQTNGAEDGPYTNVGGGAVTDSASITVATPTATPTETPTEPPATPTKPPTPSPTPTETPTPTQGQTPGFGITVAVISLAAAALLARRRLN